MKRLLVFGLAALVCMSTAIAQKTHGKVGDGVFIHISSNDPHRVVMALSMALKMSEDKDVLIYCDIKGIDVVLKDAPDVEYPTFPSARTSLKKLIEKGIRVFACPACMKAAGKTSTDLMAGVKTAEKEAFFNFTKGRILTLDY
jgi:predicted peroxiredoxin